MLFWLIPGRYRVKYLCVVWSIAVGVCAAVFLYKAWALGDMPRAVLYGAGILVACLMAILPRVPIFASGLFVIGGLFWYDYTLKGLESAALRPIVETAATMVKSAGRPGAPGPPADSPAVPGKIVVWDMAKNRLSDAHFKLPASLRATAQDTAMTLFLLSNIESKQVDTYYKIGEASQHGPGNGWGAYRDTATLAVVTWPGPRLVGWHSVVGDAPPKRVKMYGSEPTASDRHGDLAGPIAQWIRILPGIPSSPPRAPITLLAFAPSSAAPPSGASASSLPANAPSAASAAAPSPAAWTVATAQKEAMRRHPQLAVPNSPLNRAFLARYKKIQASNPSYLSDPSWPIRLADEVANQGVNR